MGTSRSVHALIYDSLRFIIFTSLLKFHCKLLDTIIYPYIIDVYFKDMLRIAIIVSVYKQIIHYNKNTTIVTLCKLISSQCIIVPICLQS